MAGKNKPGHRHIFRLAERAPYPLVGKLGAQLVIAAGPCFPLCISVRSPATLRGARAALPPLLSHPRMLGRGWGKNKVTGSREALDG